MSMPFQLEFNRLKPLESPREIQQVGMVFQVLGYQIVKVGVYTQIAFSQGELVSDQLTFGDSLDHALMAAYQHRNVKFEVLHRRNGLEFLVHADWYPPYDPEHSSLHASTYQDRLFWNGNPSEPEHDPSYYSRHILDLGKELYAATSPRFGWADHGSPEISPSDEQVETFKVFDNMEGSYWANFFPPRFVERIGHERLVTPPFGWSETLPDGGVLYVLAPTYFSGDFMGQDRQRIREYFGL